MVTSDALLEALERGIRKGRRTLVSVTAAVDVADPCATIFTSRLASDRWFCWEQPDRGFAVAGMGVAREAGGRGARRFAEVARIAGETGRDAIVEGVRGVPAGRARSGSAASPSIPTEVARRPGARSSPVRSSCPRSRSVAAAASRS